MSDFELIDLEPLDRCPADRESTDRYRAQRGRTDGQGGYRHSPRRPGPRASRAVTRTGCRSSQRDAARSRSSVPRVSTVPTTKPTGLNDTLLASEFVVPSVLAPFYRAPILPGPGGQGSGAVRLSSGFVTSSEAAESSPAFKASTSVRPPRLAIMRPPSVQA